MNIGDMISKMNTEVLKQKFSMIENMLTPEQKKNMEQAIRDFESGDIKEKLKNVSQGDLDKELKSNPELLKGLAKNPELINKLSEILKKK